MKTIALQSYHEKNKKTSYPTGSLYFYWMFIMNLDKSTKRISRRVKKGFQGYPQISLSYFGASANFATEVVVGFTSEEGMPVQEQTFTSKDDARKDETIQTTSVSYTHLTLPTTPYV